MSWDLLIMDMPRDAQTVSDLPGDFKARPLGNRSDLIAAVRSATPMADFSDPSWGQIVTRDFSIEVSMGTGEQVDSIMLHVRGGDQAVGLIAEILASLNACALDVQTGEMFHEPSAARSLAAWRAYRDQALNNHPGSGAPPAQRHN